LWGGGGVDFGWEAFLQLYLELIGPELKAFATWRGRGHFREAFGPGGGVISVVFFLSIIPWHSAYP
jgi:hypothetical protein